jgi:hypothetical protein
MHKRYYPLFFVSLLVVSIYLFSGEALPNLFFQNEMFFTKDIRLIKDNPELYVYFIRSSWLNEHKIPYTPANPQEYPQIALFFLTLPRFLTDNFMIYRKILSGMLGICFVLIIIVNFKLIAKIHQSSVYNWLLFLPSALYFTFNRFDILPALLVQLSLLFFFNKKYKTAALLVGLAGLTKWYAFLIIPIYLFYLKNKNDSKAVKHLIISFLLTVFVPLIITFWTGGIFALLEPYLFHLSRGVDTRGVGSFLFLLFFLFPNLSETIIKNIFILLEFGGLILLILSRRQIKSYLDIINWSLFLIMIFIFFSPIASPQWILWFLPLLILVVSSKKMIFLIIGYDLLNYLFFPIIFDTHTLLSQILTLPKSIILIWLIIEIGKKLKFEKFPFLLLDKETSHCVKRTP